MGVTRGVHMETHLLNGVLQVRPSECQVLESANDGALDAASGAGELSSAETLAFVAIGVWPGLQLSMPARAGRSCAYCCW